MVFEFGCVVAWFVFWVCLVVFDLLFVGVLLQFGYVWCDLGLVGWAVLWLLCGFNYLVRML